MEERLSDTMPIFRDEAERAVLGAILLDGQAVFERLENKLKPESFFKVSHQVLFSALREMNENKITIDQLTVTETLRQKGILEQCGGVGYVTELPQAVPTIANVEYYRDLILDCAVRRDLIRFGHETIKESHDISRPVKSVVEGLDQQFSRFTVGNDTNGILTVSNILTDLVDDIEKKMNSLQLYDGIESGFPVLDELTTGFKEEEMIIVGARPSIGKTAFALSMAINMAIHKDVPVGFFSLEMSAADIMRRLLSCESRVPMDRIKRPQKLQEDDLQRIYQTAVAIHKKPLRVLEQVLRRRRRHDPRVHDALVVQRHTHTVAFLPFRRRNRGNFVGLGVVEDAEEILRGNREIEVPRQHGVHGADLRNAVGIKRSREVGSRYIEVQKSARFFDCEEIEVYRVVELDRVFVVTIHFVVFRVETLRKRGCV